MGGKIQISTFLFLNGKKVSLGKQATLLRGRTTVSPGNTFQRVNKLSKDTGRGPQKYTAFRSNDGSCLQSYERCQRV